MEMTKDPMRVRAASRDGLCWTMAPPPEDVEVTLFDTGAKATPGADGGFAFTDLTPGTYTLSVLAVGYEPLQQDVSVEADKATTVTLTLKLLRSRVSGTILLEGATTHEGITVSLKDSAFTTTTDASGGRGAAARAGTPGRAE
ncbi:carboxypeptidase regulatory-like domain-containing protein [Myxococcus sp. 1LA]